MAKINLPNEVPWDLLQTFCVPHKNGFTFAFKVKPNALKDRLFINEASELMLWVRAPARDNKANKRIIELLANLFMVPKSNVEIISGAEASYKRILLHR